MNVHRRSAWHLLAWSIDELAGSGLSDEELPTEFRKLVELELARFNERLERPEPSPTQLRHQTCSKPPTDTHSKPLQDTWTGGRTSTISRGWSISVTDSDIQS
jgi:hypothetical protein